MRANLSFMFKIENRHALMFMLSLLITIFVLVFNPASNVQERIGSFGYLGIFLVMLISSATVILPAPGLVAVFAAGRAYDFFLTGIAGGLGSAIGEMTGYMFGYGSSGFITKEYESLYKKTKRWMGKHGFLIIFIFSVIPNPLFDLAGIAAGSLGYPWQKFFTACLLGKLIKSIIVAYFGYVMLF